MSTYRYPGARPFTMKDKPLFFGRKSDTDKLAKLIQLEQLVVLYAKSGLGKSSLLNAGVLPLLTESGDPEIKSFSVVPIRFGSYVQENTQHPLPFDNLLQRLEGKRKAGDWTEKFGKAALLWQALKSWQGAESDKQLLIVFDQFEELFTYPEKAIKAFTAQLAEAMHEQVPQACRKMVESQKVELTQEENEALFTDLNVKVVMVIRSDRLSYMDSLKQYIPEILRKTYELKPLNRSQAEDAILNPAYQQEGDFIVPPFDYQDDTLEAILDFLSTGGEANIESTQLQIICQYAELLVADGEIAQKTAAGVPQVSKTDIGDLSRIYRRYYNNMLEEIDDPDEKVCVRKLIEEDLIFEPDKRRISLYEGIIHGKGISDNLLKLLVDKHHLLRAEPNMSGGYTYELSHDTLVEPILEAKHARLEMEEKARREEQQRQAEAEKAEAVRRAREAEAKALEQQALRLDAEKKRRRANIASVISAGLGVIAVATSIIAYNTQKDANLQRQQNQQNLLTKIIDSIRNNESEINRHTMDISYFNRAGEESLVQQADSIIKYYREQIDNLNEKKDKLEAELNLLVSEE